LDKFQQQRRKIFYSVCFQNFHSCGKPEFFDEINSTFRLAILLLKAGCRNQIHGSEKSFSVTIASFMTEGRRRNTKQKQLTQ
jgi:hypothetical protein